MKTERVGIIGCGIIGASWALTFARAGYRVKVWQRGEAPVLDRIRRLADNVAGTGSELSAEAWQRISIETEIARALEGVDYVQESIVENLDQKAEILTAIERHVDAATTIASSTSGILPSAISRRLRRPARFLVAHALTPPHLLPVTEICPAPETAPHVIAAAVELLKGAGQSPVVLKREIAGFAANRLLGAVLNELFALVGEGVLEPLDADTIFTDGFGLRWSVIGPLAAMDLNAPAGVRDYLARYGSIFSGVAESRGATPALIADVIDRIASSLEALSSAPAADRAAARDRAIAQVKAMRSTL
ncbi:putative 3-hydroxybutyryl-CoA dehydrogenase [Sphingomonas changbaiensis NBRC 104936]|uniref:Putative 3-hydroxybutyryl-CoA dehydrogenase n=1 Tax=Sphingomonas changbaiensis NBRC 104936 TaxID=1219043 RepID=A0A0E9MN23_9SPHN|nr:3-hydroxyacyl-CoA dehydrogenase NAD-binding domain-containing protein [Sphingomonas changbaiensis]GAO38924.1 putative 3-hydroxybutyryl-CoA dehydrogenase [Sphingomonas changbaiensis NBRC 104936]